MMAFDLWPNWTNCGQRQPTALSELIVLWFMVRFSGGHITAVCYLVIPAQSPSTLPQ